MFNSVFDRGCSSDRQIVDYSFRINHALHLGEIRKQTAWGTCDERWHVIFQTTVQQGP